MNYAPFLASKAKGYIIVDAIVHNSLAETWFPSEDAPEIDVEAEKLINNISRLCRFGSLIAIDCNQIASGIRGELETFLCSQ
jgi:hypothetical protein